MLHQPDSSTFRGSPSRTENNIRQGLLDDSQYEKLLESCLEIWFQALVELGCTYGWRVGELLKLRINQIDLDNWIIRRHPGATKNRNGREAKMTQNTNPTYCNCVFEAINTLPAAAPIFAV
jgi:integrase